MIDVRNDPWAFGDRLAWEDGPADGDVETLDLIERLRSHLAPVGSPSQLIHGDILPNVLLADGRPPAVIDWPPYYRPVDMANAIAVTDAVTFRSAPLSLLDEWAAGADWYQGLCCVVRSGPMVEPPPLAQMASASSSKAARSRWWAGASAATS